MIVLIPYERPHVPGCQCERCTGPIDIEARITILKWLFVSLAILLPWEWAAFNGYAPSIFELWAMVRP